MQSTVELSRCKPCQLSTDEKSASVAPADMRALLRSEVFGSKFKKSFVLVFTDDSDILYTTPEEKRNKLKVLSLLDVPLCLFLNTN